MNAAEALDAIRAVLDQYFRAELGCVDTVNNIALITGLNAGTK